MSSMRNLKLSFQHREVTTMKQSTKKEYEEWQKCKAEKAAERAVC